MYCISRNVVSLAHGHYDTLRPLQKAELFMKALSVYDGKDLYAMMWLRAATSEVRLVFPALFSSFCALLISRLLRCGWSSGRRTPRRLQ